MSGPLRRYAEYLPENGNPSPPQRLGAPRPGHGKVYVVRDRHDNWSASWQDDYPESREDGSIAGVENFEGAQDAIMAWARSRPATEVVVMGPEPRATMYRSGAE